MNEPTFSSAVMRPRISSWELGLHSGQGRECDLPELARDFRIRIRQDLDARARVTGHDRVFRHCLDRGVRLIAKCEAEKVSGQQQIHDLTAAVGPDRASPRRTGNEEVPILDRLAFAADFLAAVKSHYRGQCVEIL